MNMDKSTLLMTLKHFKNVIFRTLKVPFLFMKSHFSLSCNTALIIGIILFFFSFIPSMGRGAVVLGVPCVLLGFFFIYWATKKQMPKAKVITGTFLSAVSILVGYVNVLQETQQEVIEKAIVDTVDNLAPIDEELVELFIRKLCEGDPMVLAPIEERAEKGDVGACFLAGVGNIGKGNEYRAFYFLEKAAVAGNADAMYFIGMMYCSGEGTSQNVSVGKKWLQDAARRGCVDARNKLVEIQKIERESENVRDTALLLRELIITSAEIYAATQGYGRY